MDFNTDQEDLHAAFGCDLLQKVVEVGSPGSTISRNGKGRVRTDDATASRASCFPDADHRAALLIFPWQFQAQTYYLFHFVHFFDDVTMDIRSLSFSISHGDVLYLFKDTCI